MLDQIKALMQVKDHIDEIKRAAVQNRDSIISLSQEITEFKEKFSEMQEAQQELLESLKEGMKSLDESKEELKKEVYDFKVLKSDLQKQILKKFEEEVRGSLIKEFEKLKDDAAAYNELKDRVSRIAANTLEASQQMDKFIQVGKNIHAKDFEMEKFAKQLLEMDKEKLELMRKIDSLERLVARMRRG